MHSFLSLSLSLLVEAVKMAVSQCCENPPTLSSFFILFFFLIFTQTATPHPLTHPLSALSTYFGNGGVEDVGGLKAYITGPSNSKLAVLLVSDIYGYETPNFRKLADKIAAAGFYVVVPDFFYGDPFVNDPKRPMEEWIKDHGTDKGTEDAKSVIAALKSKGITAIGAAGFCWGGKVVAGLAAKLNLINAAVLCHPAYVTVDDIKEVKIPIAILGGENDIYTPPELVIQFEKVLSEKADVDYFVKIFPGAEHGWTVWYDVNDEAAVKKAEEAHHDLLAWFTKYVKEEKMLRIY